MKTKHRPGNKKEKRARTEWPAVTYFGGFGGAILGYTLARVTLFAWPHPYHWAGGLAGAVVGVGAGWLRFRLRGDVF